MLKQRKKDLRQKAEIMRFYGVRHVASDINCNGETVSDNCFLACTDSDYNKFLGCPNI